MYCCAVSCMESYSEYRSWMLGMTLKRNAKFGKNKIASATRLEESDETGDKFKFGRMHFLRGGSLREKRGAINLRKCLLLSRTRRPLDLKCVAVDRTWIAVAFQRPSVDEFSRLVFHRPERNQLESRMNIEPGFFPKFAERGCLFVFARIHFALRKKPRAVVLLRPEGTAEMHEQELKLAILTAVQKKPGADFGGFRHWSARW